MQVLIQISEVAWWNLSCLVTEVWNKLLQTSHLGEYFFLYWMVVILFVYLLNSELGEKMYQSFFVLEMFRKITSLQSSIHETLFSVSCREKWKLWLRALTIWLVKEGMSCVSLSDSLLPYLSTLQVIESKMLLCMRCCVIFILQEFQSGSGTFLVYKIFCDF